MPLLVREGRPQDADHINQIYNWYVEHSTATFDLDPWPLKRRREWMELFFDVDAPYHLVVAVHQDAIIGFAYNGQLRNRPGYVSSTEVTVYTQHSAAPKGTGSQLFESLFDLIAKTDLHRAYAVIGLPNDASIRLHQKFGFERVGLLDQVGTKFGRRVDVAWYQKRLDQ